MSPKIIKGITLLSFVCLIISFICYRMGKFDDYIYGKQPAVQGSSNGGSIAPFKSYSLQTLKLNERPTDSVFKGLLTDNQLTYWDSIKKKQLKLMHPVNQFEIMASSKSIQIFRSPKDVEIMSSSKSGQVFKLDVSTSLDFIMDTVKLKRKN